MYLKILSKLYFRCLSTYGKSRTVKKSLPARVILGKNLEEPSISDTQNYNWNEVIFPHANEKRRKTRDWVKEVHAGRSSESKAQEEHHRRLLESVSRIHKQRLQAMHNKVGSDTQRVSCLFICRVRILRWEVHACASTRRWSQSRPFCETADELFATLFVRGGLWGAQQLRACSASLPETHGGSARLLIAASRRPEIEQHSQRERWMTRHASQMKTKRVVRRLQNYSREHQFINFVQQQRQQEMSIVQRGWDAFGGTMRSKVR